MIKTLLNPPGIKYRILRVDGDLVEIAQGPNLGPRLGTAKARHCPQWTRILGRTVPNFGLEYTCTYHGMVQNIPAQSLG